MAWNVLFSALCLRLFGEDTTPFGKELQAKKQGRTDAAAAAASTPGEDGGLDTDLDAQAVNDILAEIAETDI